ncbi:MAG TPA: helix-hairpin-helix domain-containing protein [Acidobacteriaceae bacterium]|nr:helix-hairpin-helix domain-containing protein [Acidobacteriaceae bacterium]
MRKAVFIALMMAGLVGCTREQRSPDAIRNDTAHATAGAVRDGKAVVEGVFDGLRQKGPVNINKASSDDLERLPGVTPEIADRIIAGRPYQNGADLYHRRIVSKAEYNQIADKIEAR